MLPDSPESVGKTIRSHVLNFVQTIFNASAKNRSSKKLKKLKGVKF
jgi:hypothetical protein